MSENAFIEYDGKKLELETMIGSENEVGVDITQLRAKTGMITLDPGYGNTGSCTSDITYIDGNKGILRYRGYSIEELAEKSTFLESAFLTLYGHLPSQAELDAFEAPISADADLPQSMKDQIVAFPEGAPPMAVLSAMLNTLACHETDLLTIPHDGAEFDRAAGKIMAKSTTIAAAHYRATQGLPFIAPNPKLSYSGNFLNMMFGQSADTYEILPEVEAAIDLFFILHADHEQNCSTSTVRMVGSSRANLFSSVSAGVGALWGPLHGGANAAVIDMLENIHTNGIKLSDYVDAAKDKNNDTKLMGFGHRVYKSFDPRAKILKTQVDSVLAALNIDDPLLDIAKELEQVALNDEYFVSRNLYPNVDFYSGILLSAIGIPVSMFTVLFAIGRAPGWMANWREMLSHNQRICRPRQVYTGANLRSYVPVSER